MCYACLRESKQGTEGETMKNSVSEMCNMDFSIYLGEEHGEDEDWLPKAHAWLEEMAPNTWIRAFAGELLLNSNSEVFKW